MSLKMLNLTLFTEPTPVAVNADRILYIHPYATATDRGTVIVFPDEGTETHLTVAESYHTVLRMLAS